MSKETAVAAAPEPAPKPEPKFSLDGKALTQAEYDAEFAKLSQAARAPKPAPKAE